jgi:hypothetical protein
MKFSIKLILALVISLLVWEVIISNFIFNNPDYELHETGIIPKIGSKTLNTQEGYAKLLHQNEFGTYDKINISKQAILYQGDSYTYAKQIEKDKNYVNLVKKNMTKFEHINAGNFGTDVIDYYNNYKYFEKYNISHYFIQLRYNDFITPFNKKKFIFIENENKSISFKNGSDSLVNFFRNNFEIYYTINKINFLVLMKEKYFNYLYNLINFNNINIVDNIIEIKNPSDYLIGQQLILLKNKYENNFTIIYLPMEPTLSNNLLNFNNVEELIFKKEILVQAENLNISIIDMTLEFEYLYFKNQQLAYGFSNTLPGTGHMNEFGHLFLANNIIEVLEK